MAKSERSNVSPRHVRTSVSVPIDDYQELERLAQKKKVSVAWIIRDAVEQYLSRSPSLFSRK